MRPTRPRSANSSASPPATTIAGDIAFDIVEAKDWVKATLEDLVPVRAGRFVVHGQHDRASVPPNKLGIEIEAALAFGTGHHGTTRGCLLLLDHVLKAYRPRRVLDLGTGTGVLAIAAAKALQRKVLASDIDPLSVQVARDNARLNGSATWCETIHATGFSAPEFAQPRPVRPGAGEHPRQSVAANGNADGAASGAIGAGDPVGPAAASGARRDRRLSRARAGSGAAPSNRRLEQPVAAQGGMMALIPLAMFWRRAMTPFSSRKVRLHARLDETIEHLDDDAALLLGDRSDRAAADRRRNLLKRESRHRVSPRR